MTEAVREGQTSQDARQGQGTAVGGQEDTPVASLPPSLEKAPVDSSPVDFEAGVRAVSGETDAVDGPRIPRVKRKEHWVVLEDEAYENFQFRMWVNYPQRLEADITSREAPKINAALRAIVLEHNGWLDEEGTPYPLASDPAFWEGEKSIPNELLQAIITLIHLEAGKLPNLLIEKSRPTRRT